VRFCSDSTKIRCASRFGLAAGAATAAGCDAHGLHFDGKHLFALLDIVGARFVHLLAKRVSPRFSNGNAQQEQAQTDGPPRDRK
jgi:hypothetical protein